MLKSRISFIFEKDYGVSAARVNHLFKSLADAPFEMALTKLLPGDVIKKHNHREYEVFIHLNGSRLKVQIGNQTEFMDVNEVIFAERDEYHEFENIGQTESLLYSIWWN